ncbi:MAG: O-antigen ligase family protein, partial [Armatimonadetes bacterium]|nr:O-antigen ligase family protein [Armatimonadota bacterium]
MFAISLQVLATIEVAGNELRFGTSDLLLPVLLLFVLWKWLKDDRVLPDWRAGHFWVWVGILTFWIGLSVINGRLQIGEWQVWAVVNKGIGWLLLVGYLLLGGWLTAFYDARLRTLFVKAFILCTWITCGYSLARYFLFLHRGLFGIEMSNYDRVVGFFVNPNAFGIFVAAVIVLQVSYWDRSRLFPPVLANLGLGVSLLSVAFTASRSAWLGFAVALPVLFLTGRVQLLPVLRGALLGLVLGVVVLFGPATVLYSTAIVAQGVAALGITTSNTTGDAGPSGQVTNLKMRPYFKRPYLLRETVTQDTALAERVASALKALEMWRNAPIVGEGLGSYRRRIEGHSGFAGTIHNSFLWLLAETGSVGALLFTAFFWIVLRSLYRASRLPEADPLLFGVFGVLLVLAGASIGTEIMYQRYLWFLTGLALALPRPAAGSPAPWAWASSPLPSRTTTMPKQARTLPESLIILILPVLIPDTPPGACPRLQRRRKRLW